uniref:Uncharacterized protein n=1 Tax=Nelumbo nucifera TaxID=4432 RepID=A0A822Z7T2_NELNU|nr:TPA_asm: hypothetical protein HUJ06_014064 [Nelumbo nucifera]
MAIFMLLFKVLYLCGRCGLPGTAIFFIKSVLIHHWSSGKLKHDSPMQGCIVICRFVGLLLSGNVIEVNVDGAIGSNSAGIGTILRDDQSHQFIFSQVVPVQCSSPLQVKALAF